MKSQEFKHDERALYLWSNPFTGMAASRNEVYASANRNTWEEPITGEAPRLLIMKVKPSASIGTVQQLVREYPQGFDIVYQHLQSLSGSLQANQWVLLNPNVVTEVTADPRLGRQLLMQQLENYPDLDKYFFRPFNSSRPKKNLYPSKDRLELHSNFTPLRLIRGQALDYIFGGDAKVPRSFLQPLSGISVENGPIVIDLQIAKQKDKLGFRIKGKKVTFLNRSAFIKAMARTLFNQDPTSIKLARTTFSIPIEQELYDSVVVRKQIKPLWYFEMFDEEFLTLSKHGVHTYREPAIQWEIEKFRPGILDRLAKLKKDEKIELATYLKERSSASDLNLSTVQEWLTCGLDKLFPWLMKRLYTNQSIKTLTNDTFQDSAASRLQDIIERHRSKRCLRPFKKITN